MMKTAPSPSYRPYQGLPALVGLAGFDRAMEPGLPVEVCVNRLKRFHYTLWRVHRLLLAHLATEPVYELKMAYSLHAHLAAENDHLLRARIGEMREPPLGLEKCPHPALAVLFDEILATPSTPERLLALYELVFPALEAGMRRYIEQTHPLADAPSLRLCRHALLDLEEINRYGAEAIRAIITPALREESAHWYALLSICMESAGGLDGSGSPTPVDEPTRHYSSRPFQYEGTPKRDARFPDPFNMGVNAEAFLYDEAMPAEAKVLMMYYKRLREIDVPEVMASILSETPGKPFPYYRDMTRQLWDEARHAMMGEVGFVSLGLPWPELVMINATWSHCLNTQLTPKERHSVLYFIEQGLMPKTGKRYEWVVSREAECPLAATFQDFDWADEVLHARIGRDWYVSDMPSTAEAIAFGDKSWSKVHVDFNHWQAQGLTEHRNWWPGLYQAYCTRHQRPEAPRALAFSTSYQAQRADLKTLPASG